MNCVQNMPWVQEIMSKLHVTKQHINKLLPLKSPNKGKEYREHELLFPNELFRGSKYFFFKQRGTILKI